MDFWTAFQAIILGVVEGLTEFLPISSTGHQIIVADLIGFGGERAMAFNIIIQLAAILAVVWEFRSKIFEVVFGLTHQPKARRFTGNLLLAFMPAVVLGVLFADLIHEYLFNPVTVAAALAGAAGALMAQTTGFASLDVFALERSADVMLMLVIGGVGWLYGGVVGAVVFKLMHDVISGITPQYWTFWIGLFLVVLVMVGRERLIRPWLWFGRAADQKGGAQ